MVDISTTEYDVELIDEKGICYLINDALLSLDWEEQESELAQRASIRIKDMLIGFTQLFSIAKLNCAVLIYGKWNNMPRTLIFKGITWEWQPVIGTQKELTIVAYDRIIYLQKSQDYKFYQAGLSTRDIIADICNSWSIPLLYKWGQNITHEKKVFNGNYISSMIISLLEEVRKKTGVKYVAYWRDNTLQIVGYGTNQIIYKFESEQTSNTLNKLTMNNLVTRVKIIGKADEEGLAPVEAIVDGDMRYGTLQVVLQTNDSKTLADTTDEANTIIKENGKLEEQIKETFPDLPFLRKGDIIESTAGNLIGFFNVLGVSHNATQKQMILTLDRRTPISQEQVQLNSNDNSDNNKGAFERGDEVILNGPVYLDSYGNGKGRTFTNYRNTITITAPLDRLCPYHIGSVGWVYPKDITKG